jgi:hypothetical protein
MKVKVATSTSSAIFAKSSNVYELENHRPVASPDKLYHMMLYTSPLSRFEITTALIAWVVVNPTTNII